MTKSKDSTLLSNTEVSNRLSWLASLLLFKKSLLMQNFLMAYTLFLYSPRGAYFIFLVTFLHSYMWDNKMFTYLGNKFYILLYWGWGGQLSRIFSLKECLVFTLQGPGATGAWLLSISWLVYVIIHSLSPRFSRHLHVSFCSEAFLQLYIETQAFVWE